MKFMDEKLLQFLWQGLYFDRNHLLTVAGDPIEIIDSGYWNTDQGPDFSSAKLRIGNTFWAGNVEVHIHTSDWYRHGHQKDPNYRNIILHVVWEQDKVITDNVPVLELKGRVALSMLSRYQDWMANLQAIPCSREYAEVDKQIAGDWSVELVRQRLNRKAGIVFQFLDQSKGNWSEIFWWMLARNFGYRRNADVFEEVARSLPLRLLSRHKDRIQQIEALLLGQAGLLSAGFSEAYPQMLQKEYRFLAGKYRLRPVHRPVHFLRMRPCNFPTLRLAQLAELIHQSVHLFDFIRETPTLTEVMERFKVTANDYWHYHYRLDEPAAYNRKQVGRQMLFNIMINTVIPSVYAYGCYADETSHREIALRWLRETDPESDQVTTLFNSLGTTFPSAFESQAAHELKTSYCDEKRCLQCAVGRSILRSG
jgi:hypothetical protein